MLIQSYGPVAYPGIFSRGGGGGLTNSVEDRGPKERGLGAVRGFAIFANE
jgi:hypothetical protein